MRVLICGMDGYIGWPLALHLLNQDGFEVIGIDNFSRRKMVKEVGSDSAIPIAPMEERLEASEELFGVSPRFREGDLRDYSFAQDLLERERPDAIVHLGEMPSAPYSMVDAEHAYFTQENNVLGTLNLLFAMRDHAPDAHLLKLGTMGEYGTPNVDIPEGDFVVEHNGRKDRLPFPRQPGSIYHLSKVHDSFNIMFACRVWKLRSTDIMQGVVYGTQTREIRRDSRLSTRFDYDGIFGTAINRYCAQAVLRRPVTPYGKGRQKRGFIALRDSIQCLTLALRNAPDSGEYRTFNQFDEVYDVTSLAEKVIAQAEGLGLRTTIQHIDNPRAEAEDHYYNPESAALRQLGFEATNRLEDEVESMLQDLIPHRDRLRAHMDSVDPDVRWDPRADREES